MFSRCPNPNTAACSGRVRVQARMIERTAAARSPRTEAARGWRTTCTARRDDFKELDYGSLDAALARVSAAGGLFSAPGLRDPASGRTRSAAARSAQLAYWRARISARPGGTGVGWAAVSGERLHVIAQVRRPG